MFKSISFDSWYELNRDREWNSSYDMFKDIWEAGRASGKAEPIFNQLCKQQDCDDEL
jgi:hypothetical protein